MRWRQLGETVAVAAVGGAIGAVSDALSAGTFDVKHLMRSAVAGAFIAVAALYRQPPARGPK